MRDIEFHIHFCCALENDKKKTQTTQAELQFQGLIYRFVSNTHKHNWWYDITKFLKA